MFSVPALLVKRLKSKPDGFRESAASTRRPGRGWLPKRSNCKGPFGPPCAVTPLGTRPSDARFPCLPAFRACGAVSTRKTKLAVDSRRVFAAFLAARRSASGLFCSNRFHRRTMPRRRPSAAGTGPEFAPQVDRETQSRGFSRRSAPSVARERFFETFRRVPVPAFARSRAAWR